MARASHPRCLQCLQQRPAAPSSLCVRCASRLGWPKQPLEAARCQSPPILCRKCPTFYGLCRKARRTCTGQRSPPRKAPSRRSETACGTVTYQPAPQPPRGMAGQLSCRRPSTPGPTWRPAESQPASSNPAACLPGHDQMLSPPAHQPALCSSVLTGCCRDGSVGADLCGGGGAGVVSAPADHGGA